MANLYFLISGRISSAQIQICKIRAVFYLLEKLWNGKEQRNKKMEEIIINQ